MNLVSPDSSALWTPAAPVEDFARFSRLVEKLEELRKDLGASCLAATQVGASIQLFVTKYEAFPVVFNPDYVGVGAGRTSRPESHLNRTGWSAYVPRYDMISATWTNAAGEYCQAALKENEARVFAFCCQALSGQQTYPKPAMAPQLP